MTLLRAENISLQYHHQDKVTLILDKANFAVQQQEKIYLEGASGSGKTTLLWALARLHPLTQGQLYFNNINALNIAITQWRTEIALLPQKPVMFNATIEENLYLPLSLNQQKKRCPSIPDKKALQQILQQVNLADLPLSQQAHTLSGGQQVRLALARLLLTKPKLILADEPTAGLDQIAATQVLHCLQQFCEQTQGSIILTSHTHGDDFGNRRFILDGCGHLQQE